MNPTRRSLLTAAGLIGGVAIAPAAQAAPSARQINHDVDRALSNLYAAQHKARDLGKRSLAILVFPKIVKAGFIIGGQGGNGALRIQGKTAGYYNIAAASFGLQAGVQSFSYAMFFMTNHS